MGFLNIPQFDSVCRIDIRSVIGEQYPFALAYFTGSKEENLRLRNLAKQQGFKLSEYGFTDLEGKIHCNHITSEEELYSSLDESFVIPTNR